VTTALLYLQLAVPPAFAEKVTALPSETGGTVTEIIDGDTVFLSNGDEVRMVGIQAPKLPLGRRGFAKWPLADEAATTLKSLASGREFRKHFGGARGDRHGRVLAHLVAPDGFWLQGEMLRLGLARVYTFPDNIALADEMLALEHKARQNQFGIWSHPFYKVRDLRDLEDSINTFQLVEGEVLEVADVRGTIYLNFGEDWRDDFTVMIRRKARRTFGDIDLVSLKGKLIRVRGWLKSRNGPMIEVTHAQQIEILGDQ
jgi:micrococcal nuclease